MTTTPAATGGLTPIETEYAGYRFRSRLEARWAYYFDLCRIRWAYESEGFMLSDGQRYLPDFWLPDYNQFVEVKPDSGEVYLTSRPHVYLAGKMGEPEDNKRTGPCWRPLNVTVEDYGYQYDDPILPEINMTLLGVPIIYSGPWKGLDEYHGYYHGVVTTTCGNMGERDIYMRNIRSINACNEFFALLTSKTAYGTLFETGYARGIGKNIAIGVAATKHGMPEDHSWFAANAAHTLIRGNNDIDIVMQYAEYLRNKYPETKYDIMMRDATAAGTGFRIVMGDPRTMKTKRGTSTRELPFNQTAADAARQHRFGR
jgi:nucleoside 2-deoxyribosyltransferase